MLGVRISITSLISSRARIGTGANLAASYRCRRSVFEADRVDVHSRAMVGAICASRHPFKSQRHGSSSLETRLTLLRRANSLVAVVSSWVCCRRNCIWLIISERYVREACCSSWSSPLLTPESSLSNFLSNSCHMLDMSICKPNLCQ